MNLKIGIQRTKKFIGPVLYIFIIIKKKKKH